MNENSLDFRFLPAEQVTLLPLHLLPGIVDRNDCDAGRVLLLRTPPPAQKNSEYQKQLIDPSVPHNLHSVNWSFAIGY